jgi:hypothetical protein
MISGQRRPSFRRKCPGTNPDNEFGQQIGASMMKRNLALILLCLGFSSAARPQYQSDQSQTLLRQAAHCLATSGPDSKKLLKGKSKVLSFGYYLDPTSYPGEEALYLVSYEGSKGLAFIFFVGEKDRHRVFRLENNASFVRKKKGIEFIEPPLGGIWTQEHLEAAIEHIEQEPKMELSIKDLREKFPDVRCESYSDAR